MPKERIKQGDTLVIEGGSKSQATDLHGKPLGIYAQLVHVFQPGEVLKKGDTLEEHPSWDIHWNKMQEGGDGWANLSVTIPREWLAQVLEDAPDDENYIQVYSDNLSRAELNRLITLGRHVRDSAHGRDA